MSGVDELSMVAMIEHTYHKFHQLGMETVIYLIDKEHLSFMDNTNHPHHHPEQSLGSSDSSVSKSNATEGLVR